jgi:choice-of-anchor B domain-containing protein
MVKYLLFLALLLPLNTEAQQFLNMELLGHWDNDSLPIAAPGNLNLQFSGCWGMVVNGREFAVLGGARHILIFDVTIPTQPVLLKMFEGNQNTVWREFKSYRNRLYAVSDGTAEGMMIIDFSEAPENIERVYWSNELFYSAHTITLDTSSGRIYLKGCNMVPQGSLILDVSQNPDLPTLLAATNLEGGYIHDSYVRHDTLYASSGYNGLYIYDFRDVNNPITLGSVSTGGYNHLGWVNAAGTHLYYTEEIPRGRPIQIIDLAADYDLAGSFLDNLTPNAGFEAIPHNVYIRDSFLFISQYEDGLLIYNISHPDQPELVGYYDTHPQNTAYNGYFGNWGNYPWLPSGTILAGDMQNGLYLLKFAPLSSATAPGEISDISLSPNPAVDQIYVNSSSAMEGAHYQIRGIDGSTIELGVITEKRIEVANLPSGMYFLEVITFSGKRETRRFIRG